MEFLKKDLCTCDLRAVQAAEAPGAPSAPPISKEPIFRACGNYGPLYGKA
jgi:hypothetical protein